MTQNGWVSNRGQSNQRDSVFPYLFIFYSFLIHRLIELRIGADLTCHLEKLLSHHPMFENVESLLLQTFPQLLTRLATL